MTKAAHELTTWELQQVIRANTYLTEKKAVRFMQITSFLFSPTVWNVLPILLAVISIFNKNLELGIFLIAHCLQCVLVQYSIKMLVKRKRPYLQSDQIDSYDKHTDPYCFPSGHAMFFLHFWTALSLWLGIPWIFVFGLIGGIYVAVSRVFLGVHFPSDVIVGSLLAMLSAYLLYNFTLQLWLFIFLPIFGIFL